jgi:PAS domain S-box-containing protein
VGDKDPRILIGWKEIGSYLDCSPSTAMRRVDDGLPVFRVGGSIRAFADDIDRWLEGERLRKMEAAAEAEPESPGIVVQDTNLLEAVSTLAREKKGRRFAVIPLGIDTSEFERIETRLQGSEEKYRWLVETVPAWIWETDAVGKFTYSNVVSVDVLGYRPEEMLGFNPLEFLVAAEDIEKCAAAIDKLRSRMEIVRDLQCRYVHHDGSIIWLETDAEPIFDAHGRFTGIRGVSRDVTARRRAEEALRASEEKYRTLSDNIPVGIYRTGADPRGLVMSANPAFSRMFGFKDPAEMIGRSVVDYYVDPTSRDEFIGAVAVKGEVQNYEARLKRKDGEKFWVSISARAVRDSDGTIAHIDGVIEDITDRWEAEEKIHEQNEFLNNVLSSLTHSFYVIDVADYKVLLANEAALARGVREGGTCYELTHMRNEPCNTAEHPCPLRDVVETRRPVTVEHIHYHEGCGPRIYEIHAHPIFDDRGEVVQIIEYSLDITARKSAEEALRESEEKFRTLAEESPNMIFINKGGKVIYANKKCEENMGYLREEFYAPDFDFLSIIASESKEHVKRNFAAHRRGEATATYEYSLVTKSGDRIEAIITSQLIAYEGDNAILGIVTDMTEYKRAERALRLTQFSVDRSADATFWLQSDGHFVYVNDAACQSLGYTRGELLALGVPDINPEFPAERWPDRWKEVAERGSVSFESQHRTKDGRTFPVEISINYLEFEGREYNYAFARDITERKRAEEALRESEERYRVLFEGGNDAVFVFNVGADGKPSAFIEVNDEACRRLGYSAAELHRLTPADLVPPEYRETAAEKIRQLSEDKVLIFEWVHLRKDGTEIPVEVSSHLFEFRGEPTVISVVRDITERKRAEEALRHSEEKLRRLVEHSYDGVVLMDETGSIVEYNPAHERITGIPREEALGKPIWDVTYGTKPSEIGIAEQRQGLKNTIIQFTRTGDAPWLGQPIEVEIKRPDGERRTIEQAVFPIRTERGFMAGSVTRDITDQKRADEALRKSEAYLRAAIDNLPFDLFALDETGRYSLANAALRDQWGDIVGRRPEDFAPDKATLALWQDNNRRAYAGEVVGEEVSFAVGGEKRFFYNVISPIRDGDDIRGILGVNIDITDQKRAEKTLRERETLLHSVVSHAPVAIYAYDREGTIELCEGRGCLATGYGPGELVGENVFETFGPEAPVGRPLRRALDGEEVEILLTAGQGRLFDARYMPLRDEAGNVVGALSVGTDVTEREQAREKLRVSEATLRAILNAVTEGLSFTDPEENVVLASREFASALGFDTGELEGKSLRDLTTPKKLAQMRAETEKRRRGESSTYRTALRHKDGHLVDFTVHCSPLFADDGTFLGTFGKVVPNPP